MPWYIAASYSGQFSAKVGLQFWGNSSCASNGRCNFPVTIKLGHAESNPLLIPSQKLHNKDRRTSLFLCASQVRCLQGLQSRSVFSKKPIGLMKPLGSGLLKSSLFIYLFLELIESHQFFLRKSSRFILFFMELIESRRFCLRSVFSKPTWPGLSSKSVMWTWLLLSIFSLKLAVSVNLQLCWINQWPLN